jgi:hypothetical protein
MKSDPLAIIHDAHRWKKDTRTRVKQKYPLKNPLHHNRVSG